MFEVKEGQYYYARHKRSWGVWKKDKPVNGVSVAQFISDFATEQQAKQFVYKMNGYTMKKDE